MVICFFTSIRVNSVIEDQVMLKPQVSNDYIMKEKKQRCDKMHTAETSLDLLLKFTFLLAK